MRILYVTPDVGWPLSFGGDIRKWHLLRGVLAAGDADVVVLRRPGRVVHPEAYAGGRVIHVAEDVRLAPRDEARYASTLGRGWLTVSRAQPYEYLGGPARDLVAQLAARSAYDLVWFANTRAAVLFASRVHTPTVVDGDDFAYVRERQVLHAEPWYGAKVWNYVNVAKLRRVELSLHRRVSCVLRCSAADAARHPASRVAVVPNGTTVPASIERTPAGRLVFVGDLGYLPNRYGLEWFLAHVWPAVRAEVPDARLDVIGRHASDALQRRHGQAGIAVHGFVDALAPCYRDASAGIVPVHAGSGTRLKILESLAHAVPVVSTSLGAFGLDISADAGLTIADAPDAFARACVCTIRHQADVEPAMRGRAVVAARYDWTAIEQVVAGIAQRVAATASRAHGESQRQSPEAQS
jgi:glycosyltransferase involved in cell wall biosynthesis